MPESRAIRKKKSSTAGTKPKTAEIYAQILVSRDMHKRLRIETAHRGGSVRAFVETAINSYIQAHPLKKAGAA